MTPRVAVLCDIVPAQKRRKIKLIHKCIASGLGVNRSACIVCDFYVIIKRQAELKINHMIPLIASQITEGKSYRRDPAFFAPTLCSGEEQNTEREEHDRVLLASATLFYAL